MKLSKPARLATAAAAAIVLLALPLQAAAEEDKAEDSGSSTLTVGSTAEPTAAEEESLPISGSLTIETSVGAGTFVKGNQARPLVATAFSPSISWAFADKMALTAGTGLTWYQVVNADLPYYERALWSDTSLTVSHGDIWSDKDLGLSLSGGFRIYFPTSLASQFQNRYFVSGFRPNLRLGYKVGPVSFGWNLLVNKYLASTMNPTINCDGDPNCAEGRDTFESERNGGELYVKGSGSNSFYVANSVSATWSIVEGLSATLGATVYNIFGIRYEEIDGLSNPNARAGRSQLDRLITSFSVSYTIIKQLSVAAGVSTDTVRPFGAAGDDFVIQGFTRASDNLTAFSLSLTASL